MNRAIILLVFWCLMVVRPAQAFYNQSTGRWLSRDPIGERGGLNLYGFANNSSMSFVDSDGRNPILLLCAGAVAIGAAACYLYDACQTPPPTSPITETIAKCAIKIYVGHGFLDKAFDDDGKLNDNSRLASREFPITMSGDPSCSACTVVSCNAKKFVNISNPVPGYELSDKQVGFQDNINKEIESAYKAAVAHVSKLCESQKCSCPSITIEVICTGNIKKPSMLVGGYPLCGKKITIPCPAKK